MASAWDQNAALYLSSPAASVVEEVAGEWLKELLGIPESASVGLTTGAGLANAVGLAAGRHAVLARAGWDVEARGLFGAPEVHVVVGDEVHATLLAALQYLGLGRERVRRVPTDGNGAMRADLLPAVLRDCDGPTLVAAQAGNVNTGACDPLEPIADAVAAHSNAWLHVDGAFGLWAAASPALRHLIAGSERADSWSTDAHKWLNVGYDCGVVAVADPEAHATAMSTAAAYLVAGAGSDPMNRVLDFSRRARGFALYATIRSLGSAGVCDLVERCCSLARRMAERLSAANGVEILNEVALNQVLVRFGDDERTARVIEAVQADGTCWASGTSWRAMRAMRISVSNWSTTEADIDRSADAILRAASE
jgi:glutamate/tyrosine decarboxylase-like PLP-dependent enzyme